MIRGLLMLFLIFLAVNSSEQKLQWFKVWNRSDSVIHNLHLFSNSLALLAPGMESDYLIYKHSPLTDDTMIYCEINGQRYARYLELPSDKAEYFTYSIDSLQNGILYVSMLEE